MKDLTGKQLGFYLIVYRFGAGGMANVFKEYQPRMDRYVVTKNLLRYFSKNFQLARHFSPEIHLISELEQPHILPLQDFEEADGYTYLLNHSPFGRRFPVQLTKEARQIRIDQINRIFTRVGGAFDCAYYKESYIVI